MKQTVLKQPLACTRRQACVMAALCVSAAVLTLTLNFVLLLTASERTRTIFCVLNIAGDALCGVALIWVCTEKLVPLLTQYRLAKKPMTEYTGTVKTVSEKTVRYLDMDCRTLTVNERKLFLPVAAMELRCGETYRFRLVSNIIMEAEQ